MEPDNETLKGRVRDFWNRQSCDTHAAVSEKFSREYFEEIEAYRYYDQPFIHSFAQFTRYRGKRILEVGFGAGTDFIQWVRAGAHANGVDLTQEGLDNLTHRIQVYGLPAPEKICVADAEALPFESDSFDLGYSFGVLHHSPNTEKAIEELIRVVRPGGELKFMLYNRHSICALNAWIKHALLKAQPWKSVAWALWHHVESVGTKAYTRAELRKMLSSFSLRNVHVHTELTSADYLASSLFPPLNLFYRGAIRITGTQPAWRIEAFKGKNVATGDVDRLEFSGHRLGWFHCITARKAG